MHLETPPARLEIERAQTETQFGEGRQLIEAYARFLGIDLEFQGFAQELEGLEQMYSPPAGCLLLARLAGTPIGTVGLRALEPGVCEMKRMYVLPAYQGVGAGRLMLEALLREARTLGYRAMRLDTLTSLQAALHLYRRYGFVEIPPYRFNPLEGAVYMERDLSQEP
jgi:ribosomal protein S18 acetylase RimI-like enzyme